MSSTASANSSASQHAGVDLAIIGAARLRRMRQALDEIEECYRVLRKADLNIVGECLRGQGKFYEMDHYPAGDVYDSESGAQYYYHAHRGQAGEHGHFHTFLRAAGIPAELSHCAAAEGPRGDDAVAHLIAISMDPLGYPIGLFTTNRWVTGESWYTARDAMRLLDLFEIDHAYPSWPVNRWITAMLKAFKPQIDRLLVERDRAIRAWTTQYPQRKVFEDRALEIISQRQISVAGQSAAVDAALARGAQ